MIKKLLIQKLVPIVVSVEIILFVDSLQQFGWGILAGALLVEVLNLSLSNGYKKEEKLKVDIDESKMRTGNVSYKQEIISFIAELKTQFSDLTNTNHYQESARLALNQLLRVIEKFEKFKNILDIKLDKNAITYQKFMRVTEEVYYNILDNLAQVKDIYQSIEDINLNYINSRIELLETKDELTAEMGDELNSLKDKKEMILTELQAINKYLSINEQAITDLDNMKIKLAKLKTISQHADSELDLSIVNLRKMAASLNKYEGNNS